MQRAGRRARCNVRCWPAAPRPDLKAEMVGATRSCGSRTRAAIIRTDGISITSVAWHAGALSVGVAAGVQGWLDLCAFLAPAVASSAHVRAAFLQADSCAVLHLVLVPRICSQVDAARWASCPLQCQMLACCAAARPEGGNGGRHEELRIAHESSNYKNGWHQHHECCLARWCAKRGGGGGGAGVAGPLRVSGASGCVERTRTSCLSASRQLCCAAFGACTKDLLSG